MKRRRATVTIPRPYDLEAKSDYVARVVADEGAVLVYPVAGRRRVAAERTWTAAKNHCLVSITTSHDQFLLF